jgi:DNA-binding response OmpR family regulator
LVVDDELNIRDLLNVVLSRKGYQVLLADRGSKALELFHREKPHIAILDLLMPGMNGMTVLEEIRKHDKVLPVIVLTGLKNENVEERARELGVVDFLEKSFSLHQLGQALNRAMETIGIPEPLNQAR